MCSSVLYEEAWQRVKKLGKKLLIIAPHIMSKKRIPVELASFVTSSSVCSFALYEKAGQLTEMEERMLDCCSSNSEKGSS